jgi:ABC-type branched-subunit amino acid transport system substrate-binding protein
MRLAGLARGCTCVAVVAGLAGCATSTNQTTTAQATAGGRLTVYASVPSGMQGQDVFDAEQLALTQGGASAGHFKVVLKQTRLASDTTRAITDNARQAVSDKSTIAYLSELVPGTSEASVPITNQLGILQLSPTDNALELTQPSPVLPDTRKSLFYPSESTYGYTFARVVPSGADEALALVDEMQALHVSKLYVASDGLPCTKADVSGCYGKAIAHAVTQDATAKSITVQSTAAGADAAFIGSNSAPVAAGMFDRLSASNPQLKLFGPAGLDTPAFASALGAAAQSQILVSSPGLLPADVPSTFTAAFTGAYGHAPAPDAMFGYLAMSALLDAMHDAGGSADNRSAVMNNLFGHARQSAIGTFTITQSGDVKLPGPTIVFSRFRGGQLEPFKSAPPTG